MGLIRPADVSQLDQASAIPYRLRDDRAEFCLITSIRSGRWGFPKGIIDPGETPEQTALKEAHEEAGLIGAIEGGPVGFYGYHKWQQDLTVAVLLMRVTQAHDEWDEADVRERRWASANKAVRLLARDELRLLLEEAIRRLDVSS